MERGGFQAFWHVQYGGKGAHTRDPNYEEEAIIIHWFLVVVLFHCFGLFVKLITDTDTRTHDHLTRAANCEERDMSLHDT